MIQLLAFAIEINPSLTILQWIQDLAHFCPDAMDHTFSPLDIGFLIIGKDCATRAGD